MDHPVPDAIEEVFADSGSGFARMPRNDFIDNGNDIEVVAEKRGDPEGSELLSLKFEFTRRCVLFGEFSQSFGGAEINLGNNGRFAIDPGDLADVQVGSSLFGFDMEMGHG